MSDLVCSVAASDPAVAKSNPADFNGSSRAVSNTNMEVGLQPLDAFMLRHGLSNHDVVSYAVGSGLTHKQVAKARRGRRITANIQRKILHALNAIPGVQTPVRHEDCFNYEGR